MEEIVASPPLPLFALIPLLTISLMALGLLIKSTPSAPGRFLLFAIGVRPVLSALHDLTFSPTPIGLSVNALASVGLSFVGLFIVRKRALASHELLIVYPIIAVVIISGMVNGTAPVAVTSLIKYLYFIVIMLLTIDACRDLGSDRLMRALLPALLLPLLLQLVGIPLGIAKAAEVDGSASYIGGYNHEAAFSIFLLSAMLVLSLTLRISIRVRYVILGWCFAGVLLANYRTAILAALPLVALSLLVDTTRKFVPSQRALVAGVMLLLATAAISAGALADSERFADVPYLLTNGTEVIKDPATFTDDDRHVLSGRTLIWSMYIFAWKGGSLLNHVLGFGPDTWKQLTVFYAHNTLVSALYEMGIVGVLAIMTLWGGFFSLALRAEPEHRARLIAAHLGFFILNMATMPMWLIEGMIYYGLLCGVTVYSYRKRSSTMSGSSEQPRLPAS